MKKNIFLTAILIGSMAVAQMPPPRGGGPRRHFDMGHLPDGIDNGSDHQWDPDRDHDRFRSDRYCDKYNRQGNPPEYMRACVEGMQSTEDFARQFAYSKGRLDGYLYGFAKGLRDAAEQNSNDPTSYQQGQAAYKQFQAQFDSGLQSVSSQGRSDGDSTGAQEARVRFRNAVNTGAEPAGALNQPSTGYTGATNGYASYVGQVPSMDDIARSDRYRNIPVGVYSRFDRGDRGYDHRDWAMDGRNRLSVVDLWSQMGAYGYDMSSVADGGRALRIFRDSPAGRMGFTHWQQVNVVVYRPAPPPPQPTPGAQPTPVTQPAPGAQPPTDQPAPTPAPARPPRDDRGPGRQPQQAGPGMIAVTESQDLTSYFADGFQTAYEEAARHLYAAGFRDATDDGYGDGGDIGSQIGYDEAYYFGQQNAFNSNFQASSASSYNNAYAGAYTAAFKKTFAFYQTHPVLSVRIKSIKDANNPAVGIIQPGAEISIAFEVVNEGGAPAAFTASAKGDLAPENSAQGFSIPRLKSSVFTAAKIAKISDTARSHSNASVDLVLNQAGQLIDASNDVQVLKQIELINASPSYSLLSGSGQVKVTVHNNGAIRSPSAVNASISLNDKVVQNTVMGIVEANSDSVAVLKYSNLDPLDIIAGKYTVSYQVSIDKTILGSDQDALAPADVFDSKLSYYDALYNNQAYIPSTVDRKGRLSQMRQAVIDADKAEVVAHAKEKPYWDSPSRTVIGKVLAHSRAAANGSALRSDYDNLGSTLFAFSDLLPKDHVLFIKTPSHQKSAYKNLANGLSLKGKYKD